jgi:hypothetical protein
MLSEGEALQFRVVLTRTNNPNQKKGWMVEMKHQRTHIVPFPNRSDLIYTGTNIHYFLLNVWIGLGSPVHSEAANHSVSVFQIEVEHIGLSIGSIKNRARVALK